MKKIPARGRSNDVPSPYGGDERHLSRLPSPDVAPAEGDDTPAGETVPDADAPNPAPEWLPSLRSQRVAYTPEQIGEIPTAPGVYLMRGATGEVLYVGKSVALRHRVRSYFQEGADGRLNARFLQRRIAQVEIIVTRSEKEALLLENLLIKQHAPRYNFRLTDDKSYYSIKIDLRKEFPRLEFVRTHNLRPEGGAQVEYFGPYHSSEAVRESIGLLQKIYPLRTCTDHVMNNRVRPCLLHEVGKCCAPCVLPTTREEYRRLVDGARGFLSGKSGEVLRDLTTRMQAASAEMRFEDAARLRDTIAAVRRTLERQDVARLGGDDRDVLAMVRHGGSICFVALHYRAIGLAETQHFLERDPGGEDGDLMAQFLTQFYADRPVPPHLWVSHEPQSPDVVRDFLQSLRGNTPPRLTLLHPQRGDKARAVELATLQATQILDRELAGQKNREETLHDLERRLGLPAPPRHIECFDISTHQGAANVAAMVCFRDGEPDKSSYRRFRIRTVSEGDVNDFAAMREVLERRYARVVAEGQPLPDLVLIDGGKGQLSMAVEALVSLGLAHVPVASIAKSRLKLAADSTAERGPDAEKLRTEERIFMPLRKNPVLLRRDSPALFLLQRIRDETHRFVITFHRESRRKSLIRSTIDDIPGIGPARRRQLLRHFGSITALKRATAEEIAAVPGLPANVARAIAEHLHSGHESHSEPPGQPDDAP